MIKTKEDDDVGHFFTAMMHDKVLFFSSKGVVYSLNVYDFPEGGRQAKGLPIINVLPIDQDEKITAVVPVKEFRPDLNLIMLTKQGSAIFSYSKVTLTTFIISFFDASSKDGLVHASSI